MLKISMRDFFCFNQQTRYIFHVLGSYLMLGLILCTPSFAAYKSPVWEVGVAGGFLRTPEYRGAKKMHNYYIPFPYAAYRGHRLGIDEEGIRGKIIQDDRFRFDMRFAANVPVKSSSDSKRAGMEQLDPVIELGPSVEYAFWKSKITKATGLWLRLPLRIMLPVNIISIGYSGWSFAPYLEYVRRWHFTGSLWNFGIALGPTFNSVGYHNYFYQVTSADVTSDRELYNSSLGYGGSRITFTLIGNSKHMWYGFFARFDDLHGAVFADSPLVEVQRYIAYGISIGWKFARSSQHAK